MIEQFFDIDKESLALDAKAMEMCKPYFDKTDEIRDYNQLKVLKAFTACKVGSHHLVGTTGYGYDDSGRDKLEELFAYITHSEAALYRQSFMSGTHTLCVALFGILRTGDTMLCVTGTPYDTLAGVIGIDGSHYGSLADFGVKYDEVALLPNGEADLDAISAKCKGAKVCYIQRSRGYALRRALSLEEIKNISDTAKKANPDIIVMVDNCYGEFTQKAEPTEYGADLMMGSLIKNPGGGIAPTGGYIAGKKHLVEMCAHRLTAPGTGGEIGCTLDVLRELYLGLYYASGVVADAVKTSIYASCCFEQKGMEVTPKYTQPRNDIITSVVTHSEKAMCDMCAAIQSLSPIDSDAAPVPCDMPGYDSPIIMAAGAFTMGSSIELSCDGPIREPYTLYLQGGLNFAASRAAVLSAVSKL
ncbi:MAG: methionine gamma-lyase family protein [Oscillospiraceae bacterium]